MRNLFSLGWFVFIVIFSQLLAFAEKTYDMAEIFEFSKERQDLRASCGPVALARCLSIIGNEQSLYEVLRQFSTKSREGVVLGELIEVSSKYVPESIGCKIAHESIRKINCPAILFVDEGRHCLVLEVFNRHRNTATVWDPATFSSETLSYDQLKERWNGEVILFVNNSYFSNWLDVFTAFFFLTGLYFCFDYLRIWLSSLLH